MALASPSHALTGTEYEMCVRLAKVWALKGTYTLTGQSSGHQSNGSDEYSWADTRSFKSQITITLQNPPFFPQSVESVEHECKQRDTVQSDLVLAAVNNSSDSPIRFSEVTGTVSMHHEDLSSFGEGSPREKKTSHIVLNSSAADRSDGPTLHLVTVSFGNNTLTIQKIGPVGSLPATESWTVVRLDTGETRGGSRPFLFGLAGFSDCREPFVVAVSAAGSSGLKIQGSRTTTCQDSHEWDVTEAVELSPIYIDTSSVEDPCLAAGSIIACENQSLGEALAVAGTPFSLHYQSDRTSGFLNANPFAELYAKELGGWTLDVHHRYEFSANTLFLGTGGIRASNSLGTVQRSAAGGYLIASEDGQVVYEFDALGMHTKTLHALTGAALLSFAYSPDSQLLTTVTDGDGNQTVIQRDAEGQPTAIVGPYGQNSQLAVDANGYLTSMTNPAGEAYRMTYTNVGLLTEFKDPKGNTSQMSYDDMGRLIRDTDAAGGEQTFSRIIDGSTFTVTRRTAQGRTTQYQTTQHIAGGETRVITTEGIKAQRSRGADGSKSTVSPDGMQAMQMFGPDPRFGLAAAFAKDVSITTPSGLKFNRTATRSATLADAANLFSLTALTDTVTLNGRTFTRVYDAATRTTTNRSATGRTGKETIDSLGRIVQSQAPGLLTTNLAYDTRGRLSRMAQGEAPDDRAISFTYNPEGYLDTLSDPLGHAVSFGYDAAGRVTKQTLPDGREISYEYDANGNLTSLTPPGRPGHVFKYDKVDQTSAYEPPPVAGTGNTVYEYNLDKDLTKITRPDGQALTFDYDRAGRLKTLTLPGGQLDYDYDATSGKLTKVTAQDATLAYTFNGALLTKTAWTGSVTGQVDRVYDNDFRVTSLSVNGATPVTFQYDADSLLTKAGELTLTRSGQNGLLTGTALANVTDSYIYNGFSEVLAYEAKYDTTSLLRFDYSYDKLGRITQKKEIRGGATHTFDYGYDTAGRLIEVKRDGVVTSSYGYDANGNRTHLNGAVIAHYDDQDRLTDYQGATYQYRDNGELQKKTVDSQLTQYDYDVLGNLRKVTLANGTIIDYLIDGQNRRIGKKRNGTLEQGFLYQGQLQPIAELDGSGNVISRFVYAIGINIPDYMIKGGVTYRIIKDHLGSPRLVVDVASNTVAQELEYDAFGNVTKDTNPGFQPFGFAGGLYDRDTKLVRFGARDYDAETGRWTAKDPIMFGGEMNFYSYAVDDPVNYTDSRGLADDSPQNVSGMVFRPGPNHIDLPKAGSPGYLEALRRAIKNSLGYPTTDPGHFQKYLESIKAAARRGCKDAIDIARPVLERGVDYGRSVGTIMSDIASGPFILIINPVYYQEWQRSPDGA